MNEKNSEPLNSITDNIVIMFAKHKPQHYLDAHTK